MRTVVWFRGKDLRLADHAPLLDAVAGGGDVIPLFVLDPHFFSPKRAQRLPHRMQFLLQALCELQTAIAERGSRLVVVSGRSVEVLPTLAQQWQVDRVVAHRWVEPFGRERDRRISEVLASRFVLYEGETLWPPGSLRTGKGTPYAVFSPFARALTALGAPGSPVGAPRRLPSLPVDLAWDVAEIPTCEELGLAENSNVIRGGEKAAQARLGTFLANSAERYQRDRDRMDVAGTSRLSADLKFGTLSIRSVWHDVHRKLADGSAKKSFLNELLWREFSHSTLWDRPEVLQQPFRREFVGFPWRNDERLWRAWSTGSTGYPIVDAAARQLLSEGFVHNRARMVGASFLTKHCLIDYRRGEDHYMRYLVDGDWAQNNMGWQWSAGCGCDAQPYFRVFNPMSQGEKFDPNGDYVRRYVPELAQMPTKYIHQPWKAPPAICEQAGVRLGETYPAPVVDHAKARMLFLSTAKEHLARSRAAKKRRTAHRSPTVPAESGSRGTR